jgi:hypothetical protein
MRGRRKPRVERGTREGEDAGDRGITGLSAFGVAAVSLPGTANPAIPIAASRAGAMGILDLSGVVDPDTGTERLGRLMQLGDARWCGVLIDPREEAIVELVLEGLSGASVLWVDGRDAVVLSSVMARARGRVSSIGVVVTSADQLRGALDAEPDFLVVKGHESGGWIGEETSYILAQEALRACGLPVWVWGGMGWHTAPACRVAGVAGVVLDWQLALLRESSLPAPLRGRIERMDGSETAVVRLAGRAQYRILAQPGFSAYAHLESCARGAEDTPMANPRCGLPIWAGWARFAARRVPGRWVRMPRSPPPFGRGAARPAKCSPPF